PQWCPRCSSSSYMKTNYISDTTGVWSDVVTQLREVVRSGSYAWIHIGPSRDLRKNIVRTTVCVYARNTAMSRRRIFHICRSLSMPLLSLYFRASTQQVQNRMLAREPFVVGRRLS